MSFYSAFLEAPLPTAKYCIELAFRKSVALPIQHLKEVFFLPLPQFIDVDGSDEPLLPPGIHEVTVQDIHDVLVASTGDRDKRMSIFTGWVTLRALIRGLLPIQHEYVDGSFVTSRQVPSDIDVSFWARADDINALGGHPRYMLDHLIKSRLTIKDQFKCDIYLVPECEVGHPNYIDFLHMKDWTERYWRSYQDPNRVVRPNVEKGYLKVVDS